MGILQENNARIGPAHSPWLHPTWLHLEQLLLLLLALLALLARGSSTGVTPFATLVVLPK